MDFRGFSDVFQGVFWVFSGGFPMKFSMDFRGVSGVYQIVFRRFSVPLNQILFGWYSEHESPIVLVVSVCEIILSVSNLWNGLWNGLMESISANQDLQNSPSQLWRSCKCSLTIARFKYITV